VVCPQVAQNAVRTDFRVALEPGSARDGILATRKGRSKTGTGAREL